MSVQLLNREGITTDLYFYFGKGTGYSPMSYRAKLNLTLDHVVFVALRTMNRQNISDDYIGLFIVTDAPINLTEATLKLLDNNETQVNTATVYFNHTVVNESNIGAYGTGTALPWLTTEQLNAAKATARQRTLHVYDFTTEVYGYYAGLGNMDSYFTIQADGVPIIIPDDSTLGVSPVTMLNGHYFQNRLNLSGFYSYDGARERYQAVPQYSEGVCYLNFYWLWVDANGDIDKRFDIDTPFVPIPTDFYITVDCQTNGEASGEQAMTFTWEPQNIEELDIDLSNVSLHFDFSIGENYQHEIVVPYSDGEYATNYKSITELMGVPWWRNLINKLPLPSQDTNTTISCVIWWRTISGDAGKCLYLIKYNGSNEISVEKAKDTQTGYWTYLTSSEGDESQDYDEDPNPYTDLSDFGGGTDSVNGSALLTTSYSLSVANAHAFGDWLWSTGFDLSQLKMVVNNPIENIVSCKLFPFSVSGAETTVKLGNVASNVTGNKLAENVARTFDFGEVAIPKRYDSFLDYAPYTECYIYLPYIGIQSVDTNLVMGQTIKVRYYVDLVTGTCRAVLFLVETGSASVKKIAQWDGMIGQDVPVVGSNRAQVEAGYIVGGAQAVADFAGGIGNAIMGNIGAGVAEIGSAIKGGLQTAMQQYHTYTSGTPSPALSRFDEQRVTVYVNRPVYTKPEKFNHQNGQMCNLTCKLNELHGYTVIDNTVDLSGIPCSKEERDELLKLLTSGVYL